MKDVQEVLAALQKSDFRRSKKLGPKEIKYLADKGFETVLEHAAGFIASRLAPPYPTNDGKQTPWRGHPVFIAQHATATCCRSCLAKWHHIPKGRELSETEQAYVVGVIGAWLKSCEL